MTQSGIPTKEDIAKTLGVSDASAVKPRFKRWRKWGIAAVILLGLLIIRGSGNKANAVHYVTQPVTMGNLVVSVSATGTLAPVKKVDVGIEVSGTIKTIEVDYNDEVKVGQVLARLDTTKLESQALQAKAALASAEAKLLQARASVKELESKWGQLNRVRELSGGKMPSQADLDAAEASLARAKADEASANAGVDQAKATLNIAETDLSKAVIISPINGVVLTRNVEPGQTVAASFSAPLLFTLAQDLKEMELLVDIDEADVGSVQKGQEAAFTVDAYPDHEFPAAITQVRYGSETVDGVVTYKAVLRVDNSELLLRPGMTATAVIRVKNIQNALLVPNAALRFVPPVVEEKPRSGGSVMQSLLPHPRRQKTKTSNAPKSNGKEQKVWTLCNGQLTAVPFTKGISNGVMTEVTDGELEPGMELVTDMETAV